MLCPALPLPGLASYPPAAENAPHTQPVAAPSPRMRNQSHSVHERGRFLPHRATARRPAAGDSLTWHTRGHPLNRETGRLCSRLDSGALPGDRAEAGLCRGPCHCLVSPPCTVWPPSGPSPRARPSERRSQSSRSGLLPEVRPEPAGIRGWTLRVELGCRSPASQTAVGTPH